MSSRRRLHNSLSVQAATARGSLLIQTLISASERSNATLELDIVVRELAELGIVETHLLFLGGGAQAQAGNEVHQEEDDAGHDEGVGEAGDAVGELVAELDVIVVEPAARDLGEAVEVGDVVT